MPAGPTLIHIALHRTKAVVGHVLHLLRQEETEAKAGQHRENRISFHIHGYIHGSVCLNVPGHLNIQNPLNVNGRDGKCGLNLHFFFRFMYFRLISSRHNPVVLGLHPLQLDVPVIVRGRSPDVVLHRTIQKTLIFINHLCENAGELIISVTEIIGGNDEIMVVLIHSKVFSCMVGSCQKRFCRLVHILSCLNSKLVKAQLEACGKHLRGLL